MKRLLWFVLGVGAPAVVALWVFTQPTPPATTTATIPEAVDVPRTQLELRSARLYPIGATGLFNGLMVEHYPEGALRSRSAVTNGLLHGLSEGWHTNGQLQVAEHFKQGISHGLRTKWHPGGGKLSEANIVEGQLDGAFRKWYESGVLAEQVEFSRGQPQGSSLAYFPSGFLKARAKLQTGQVVEQQFWKDGESEETLTAPHRAP